MKNKSLTSHIMSYIIGEELCEYLKNRVHYQILNELQVFQLSRFCSQYRDYLMQLKLLIKI